LSPPQGIEAVYPLTPVQHGMLFHRLLGGAHTGVDVEQMIATLHEELDDDALHRAWIRVVERHAVLRTRFRWEGIDRPVQEVLTWVLLPFEQQSFQSIPAAERAARFDELLHADRRRGFDLDVAPMMRVAIVHFGATDHRLVWTFSHSILDGGSFASLVKEVFSYYETFRRGGDLSLEAPRCYRDHLVWLEADISAKGERAAEFFRSMLAGFTSPTQLPFSAPEVMVPRGPQTQGEEELRLSRGTTGELRALAEAQPTTVNTCVQLAWALILSAHAGEDDVVFGATRACRRSALPEVREMMGVFVNTLPVRVKIADGARVLTLLKDLRAAQVTVREFENTPLAVVQALTEVPRGVRLFDSIVVFNEALVETVLRAQGGQWLEREIRFVEQTNFPLALFVYAEPELLLKLSYDRARFDTATIGRLLTQLSAILTAMASGPRQEISAIPRLSREERRKVLVEWNETTAPSREDRCIHELVAEQAERSPEATAVAFRDASITYRQLAKRTGALARKLRTLGVGPEVKVGIFVERSIDMVVGLLGILEAGGAYVPLDPSYPRERLAWMLEDAKAPVLVTQARLEGSLPSHVAVVVRVDAVDLTPDGTHAATPSGVTPENLAYVIFTSGSTGRPKGVMVRHRNVASFFTGMDERVGGDGPGVWLALTSISFDISVLELFWTLARGFKVVVQEEGNRRGPATDEPRREASGRPMGFSLFYFAADAAGATGDKYRLLLDGARFADDHGFMAVWTPERHFHAFGGLYPNPSITSAAIAAITKRIQIRAGSIVLPLHNPIRVAEEWSVVDNISGGRVGLSFASGWHANDFALLPENYEDRREVMARGIETIKRLFRGLEVPAKSGNGSDISVRIFPAPIQKEPPIWVTAAGAPETFKMAGRIGANVLTNLLGQSVADLGAKVAIYRTARKEAGIAGEGHVSLVLHTFVGADLDEVREKVRRPFIEYLKTSTDLVKQARWEFPAFAQPGKERAGDAAPVADTRELTSEELDAMMVHAFERYFRTNGLFGTPDTCLEMVESLKGIGVDEIACLVDFGVEANVVMEGLAYLDCLRERSIPRADREASGIRWDISAQIRRHGVTHLQCTPSLARLLASDEDTLAALAPLRMLLLGGEALPPALAEQLGKVVAGSVVNMYGPTETTVWSTTSPVGKHGEPITIGRPIANTQLYVLDARRAPVPIGARGELFIGGAGVARGYLERPELTEDHFIQNPFSVDPAARLYRTGDLVRYQPDGDLLFVGRVDHQVKIRGYRVELGEIEAALGEHAAVQECVAVVREDVPGDKQVVAYVVPRAARCVTTEVADGGAWRRIWDDAYQKRRGGEPTFNVAGWSSSYTGDPIPEPDMREWVEHTAARILALRPRRVLEIGCGAGMLLFRVAPHVERYTAADFSSPALRLIEAELPAQRLSNVVLRDRPADDFGGIEPGSIDTIVINSVIQYFPSLDYLARVLEQAMQVLAPGGAVFVGDVRSFALLPELHTAIELSRAPDATPRAELVDGVRMRMARESELTVAPDFFHALRARLPQISAVSIQLKRGARANELTRFRYDVVLHKAGGEAPATGIPASCWVASAAPPSLAWIRALLREEPAAVGVACVPNARLVREALAVALLQDSSGPRTAGELRAAIAKVEGVDPEAVFMLDVRYDVDLTWSSGGAASFDVVFRHREKSQPPAIQAPLLHATTPWTRYSNQPARTTADDGLIPELRAHLRKRLPDSMLPGVIVILDALARTPSGKLDRKGLPAPDRTRKAAVKYTAPANEIEEKIAAVWREVLNLEQVGTHDNFFDLGANSLLMMQANGKLGSAFSKRLSLVEMFRFTTVSSLAAYLGEGPPAEPSFQDSQDRARTRSDAMQRRRDLRHNPR
jgi:natural product biosynthesis luciferase-like monooxygenase protein